MLTYADIRPYVEQGQSVAEITTSLLSDPRHKKDVMATGANLAAGQLDLLHVLAARLKVLRIGANAQWKGPLVDYFNAQPDTDPLKQGFELLLSQLQISGRVVFCNSDPATGALTTGITQVVGGLLGDQAVVKAEVDALTGGLVYEGVTEQEVQAVFDEAQYRNSLKNVANRGTQGIEAAEAVFRNGGTEAEMLAAAQAIWNA